MKTGEKIRSLRKEKGLSVEELARKVGYKSAGALTSIENGKREPSYERKVRIAAALGIQVRELYERTEKDRLTNQTLKEIKELDEDTLLKLISHIKNLKAKETEISIMTRFKDSKVICDTLIKKDNPVFMTREFSGSISSPILTSLLTALAYTSDGETVTVKTNSKYIVNGLNRWLDQWSKNGWVKKDGEKIKNRELWEEIKKHKDAKNIKGEYIREGPKEVQGK